MVSSVLHAVISGLHDLAAVMWVGAILINALVLIPAFKGSPMEDMELRRKLMMQAQRRLSLLVPPSIVVVVVTGILEARSSPAFHGLLSFANAYSTILLVKVILTAVMIITMVARQMIMKRIRSGKASKEAEKLTVKLVYFNAVLGVIVILLSGALSAVA